MYSTFMKISRNRRFVVCIALFSVVLPISSVHAQSVGKKCSKAGALSGTAKSPLVCKKVGKRLVWKKVRASSTTTTVASTSSRPSTGTVSQRNAVSKAASYLRTMAFSRSGLISQLEFEGFSNSDATYGVDAQNANWRAQAVKKGASYLRTMAFSRSGLISQLEFEGFSSSEATYGTDAQNADWNAQAAKKAASYLRTAAFSRSGLISQLEFEGFTLAQAEYGVNSVGL
jgi:hypothetical protein